MSHQLPTPLPLFDRKLLRIVATLVPTAERKEWSQVWQAELWHVHHRILRHRIANRSLQSFVVTTDLSIGLVRDALWLRTDSWRRSLSGTPTICLVALLALSFLAAVIALALIGSWHSLSLYLRLHLSRSLFAAPFVVFVSLATATSRHLEHRSTNNTLYWIRRQIFFAIKTSQVLLVAFLLSEDVCQPIHASFPNTADVFQVLCFVIIALIGVRWSLHDQQQRCKQCLQSLTTPARVGRPSHNLLEWNGTELSCKQGHGLLSIPEMETSWCQSSQWIILKDNWEALTEV